MHHITTITSVTTTSIVKTTTNTTTVLLTSSQPTYTMRLLYSILQVAELAVLFNKSLISPSVILPDNSIS